jgi:hypothetical protein
MSDLEREDLFGHTQTLIRDQRDDGRGGELLSRE